MTVLTNKSLCEDCLNRSDEDELSMFSIYSDNAIDFIKQGAFCFGKNYNNINISTLLQSNPELETFIIQDMIKNKIHRKIILQFTNSLKDVVTMHKLGVDKIVLQKAAFFNQLNDTYLDLDDLKYFYANHLFIKSGSLNIYEFTAWMLYTCMNHANDKCIEYILNNVNLTPTDMSDYIHIDSKVVNNYNVLNSIVTHLDKFLALGVDPKTLFQYLTRAIIVSDNKRYDEHSKVVANSTEIKNAWRKLAAMFENPGDEIMKMINDQ